MLWVELMHSFRSHFASKFFLKHHMGLILLGTGLSGVLANRWLFSLGLERLVFRYPIAVILSFAAFLLLMRLWLTYISRAYSQSVSANQFDHQELDDISRQKGFKWDWDAGGLDGLVPDEPCGCLFTIIVIILGGIVIVAFSLIAEAPLILAEAAFQFLLAAGLIRVARKIDRPDWVGSIVSRTWKPFVVVLIGALLLGSCAEVSCHNPTTIRNIVNSCKGKKGI
jgi:hypothetical protein